MADASKRRPPNRSVNRYATKATKAATKTLANDIVGFGDRLNAIEGHTSDLSRRMDQLIEVVSNSLNQGSPLKQTAVRPDNAVSCTPPGESSLPKKPVFDSVRDLLNADDSKTFFHDGSDEQCQTFSTISLFRHARALVLRYFKDHRNQLSSSSTAKIHSESSSSGSKLVMPRSPPPVEVQRQDNLCPLPTPYQEKPVAVTPQSVGLPQRSLLEAALDSYFENVSLGTPLFCKETLLDAIETQYSLDGPHVDRSWALCFDCILLQSLEFKSKLIRSGSNFRNTSNDDLETLILETLKCVVLNLDEFSQPRLINVQALLLLSLIARDYFHFSEFEKVFDRACHITKSMRLQEHSSTSASSAYQESERRNLIWALYIVDKQRVNHCRNPKQELELAHLQLVGLLEEIYKHLYSASAKRQPLASQQEVIIRLITELDAWRSQSRNTPEPSGNGEFRSDQIILRQKMTYMFHVAQILVIRWGFGEDSERLCLENARAALGIIHSLCTGTSLLNGELLAVERLLRNNSIIAYFEIFENLLNTVGPKRKEDLILLSTVTNALGLLSHPNRADSYLNRLHKRLIWCTQIAVIVCNDPILPAPANGLSPKVSGSSESSSTNQAASLGEFQQGGWPNFLPQDASYPTTRKTNDDMLVDPAWQSRQPAYTSPPDSNILLKCSSTELPSPDGGSSDLFAGIGEYFSMNAPFPDTTMASLCDPLFDAGDTFLPQASPLFFGDDVAFDHFYQNSIFQPRLDIPGDTERLFPVQ